MRHVHYPPYLTFRNKEHNANMKNSQIRSYFYVNIYIHITKTQFIFVYFEAIVRPYLNGLIQIEEFRAFFIPSSQMCDFILLKT